MVSKQSLSFLSSQQAFKDFLTSLKSLVKERFISNPALVFIKSSHHQLKCEKSGIEFNVKILESLGAKPTATKETFSTGEKKDNPFLPPFEEGQFITDLLSEHRMIFNKYCVCDEHVLVITKEFESQIVPLCVEDFKNALLVCKALEAMLFFNCGYNSGASIPHKHMQVIPYKGFQGYCLPIEEAAKRHYHTLSTKAASFELPALSNIKHQFLSLKEAGISFFTEEIDLENPEELLTSQATMLQQAYTKTLEDLGYSGKSDNHDDYNLILMRDFLLIVMRRQEGVKHSEDPKKNIIVNSLGFAGTIAVKNVESLEYLRELGPITVLEAIAKPKVI
ncbi:hypothetical protein FGO68_gene119 [Halteria grandinella]|uniref:ATP adenylyltransferase n=1 Tax=Halteria grandinella TaxID=5974 RepID=A0A8J8NLA4_HALGN|nr:hypothetical protein FGO68_gene119 [Halteria grandinella]